MKLIRMSVWLFSGFLLQGCSEDSAPVSTRQPEASQPPVTSTPTQPSTGQTSPDSSVPPAMPETAPITSAGTEAMIEGLNIRGLNEAVARARAAYDSSPQDPAAATQFINLIEGLGISLSQQGNSEGGNKALIHAVELLDSALKAGVKIDPQVCSEVYYNGGCAKALENKVEDAMVLIEKAMDHGYGDLDQLRADADLAAVRALPGFSEKLAAWEAKAPEAALEQANADADRRDVALKRAENMLARNRTQIGTEHPNTILSMDNLAVAYFNAGRPGEAIKLMEEVLTIRRKVNGPDHFNTALVMDNLAVFYYSIGRLDDAAKLREELLVRDRKQYGPEHPSTIKSMYNVAVSYFNAGRYDDAVKLQEELLTLSRKVNGPDHPDTIMVIKHLANCYHAAGRHDEAFKLSAELLALIPDDPAAHNEAAWNLATSPDNDGRYPQAKQAVAWARRACELVPNNSAQLNTLGVALYRAEQWQEASDALQKSIEFGADVPHNWLFIAMSHWQMDQKDKAKEWYDKSLTMQAAARFDAELHGFFAEAAKLMAPDSEGESEATEPKP